MPHVVNELIIESSGERRSAYQYLRIDSDAVIEQIEALGFEEKRKIPKGAPGRCLSIVAPAHDERWPKIIQILHEFGLEWYPHLRVHNQMMSEKFTIRRERVYSRDEIRQAELLRLAGSSRKFADFMTDSSGEVYVVEVNQHLKNKIDFGCSYYHVSVLMSEKLQTALKATKLKALKFQEATYDKPRKPGFKSLWQLGSTVRMPACKTQRQDTHGNFVTEDGPPAGKLGYYWDDAGFQPAELVYSRAEVEQLPPFDIAMTREFVGEPFAPYREIIVTQRFREAMEKQGIKTAEWAPVRLV